MLLPRPSHVAVTPLPRSVAAAMTPLPRPSRAAVTRLPRRIAAAMSLSAFRSGLITCTLTSLGITAPHRCIHQQLPDSAYINNRAYFSLTLSAHASHSWHTMPTSHNISAICLFSLTACTCQASSVLSSDVPIAEEDIYCCGMLSPQSLASAAVPLFHLHIFTPIFLYGQKYNRMTTTTRSITVQADYDQINIIQKHPELQYGKVHGVDNVALCTSDRLQPITQVSQGR